jgi:hypothetical protein
MAGDTGEKGLKGAKGCKRADRETERRERREGMGARLVKNLPREPKTLVKLGELMTFPNTCFLGMTPTAKQDLFLSLRDYREVFYGGAAGGGKSMALLMGALEYVRFPGYAALIIRKDFSRLGLAGGLMQRAQELFSGRKRVRWIGSRRTWEFWTGDEEVPASITFGFLSRPLDKFRCASSEFQYIAFDELTDFSEEDYLFLFSRLRRSAKLQDVPLRMRSASNPGGRGHAWVKGRFIPEEWSGFRVQGSAETEGETEGDCFDHSVSPSLCFSVGLPEGVLEKDGRLYVPSRIVDNPHLDGEEYRQSLLHLPPVERERLLNGDWSVQEKTLIQREWLRYYVETLAAGAGSGDPRTTGVEQVELMDAEGRCVATVPEGECYRFMTIDPAGTAEDVAAERRGRASWSVIQVWDQPRRRERSQYLILRDQERVQVGFVVLCSLIKGVWRGWRAERIFVEGERLGLAVCNSLSKAGLPIECLPTGNRGKVERATTLMDKLARGEVFLPEGRRWLRKFEDELLSWTGDKAEPADQIDAAAYAARVAEERRGGVVRVV